MKTWWPFLLALAAVVVLVGCYLMGWAAAAWIIAGALIALPLLYAGAAILAHEIAKAGERRPPL